MIIRTGCFDEKDAGLLTPDEMQKEALKKYEKINKG